MKAQFRMADRAGVAYAAVLGEREVADGIVTLRRLDDGSEVQVARDGVAAVLKEGGS